MFRLLIVDPRENCDTLCRSMDWPAFGVDSIAFAASYAEAVGKALDLQPQVALVDTDLGDHPGTDLVSHLRSTGLKTVFCMMAEQVTLPTVRSAMRAGARDILYKPLAAEDLSEFLEWAVTGALRGTLPASGEEAPELDPVLGVAYSSLSKITNKILLLVRSDYRRSLSLTAIAEDFSMSSKYIGRIFLKDTGMRFSEYLMAYRMLEARKLVQGTNEKISVIAGMVGYSQLNNFYTHFRNYFGVSPSSMRNFDAAPEEQEENHEKSV